jgi:predicted O-methyltransferase YrrM
MKHFHKSIDGWFSYPKLYRDVVKQFSDNSNFVEVGSWLGKSAAYMAVEIANSSKNINFYCVDMWSGVVSYSPDRSSKIDTNSYFYEKFLTNIEPVKDFIIPVAKSSLDATKEFQDNSLDFIFIDASHDYQSVKQDIEAWYPKLKPTGVFAGHDYLTSAGVRQAVEEFCTDKNLTNEPDQGCWIIRDNANKDLYLS